MNRCFLPRGETRERNHPSRWACRDRHGDPVARRHALIGMAITTIVAEDGLHGSLGQARRSA